LTLVLPWFPSNQAGVVGPSAYDLMMARRAGWEPEPTLGDALAGDGGMSDPSDQPSLFYREAVDVFPDALSALLLLGPDTKDLSVPAVLVLPTVAPPVARTPSRQRQRAIPTNLADGSVSQPQLVRTGDPGPAVSVRPISPAGQPRATFGQRTPAVWSPPSGLPTTGHSAPGTSSRQTGAARLPPAVAPPLGRRPTAGVGFVPASAPASAVPASAVPASAVRPPAYLPPNPGLLQRAASQQVRYPAAGTVARPTASRTRAGTKASNAWAFVVFLVITLFATGAAQQIIAVISKFLQSR